MMIADNLKMIRQQIGACAERCQRDPASVQLLAVTKGQSIEKIRAAILEQQTAFGENYLQEALPKIAALKDTNLEWHFIGDVQRNKTKAIATHFAWVHSVSSELIASRLSKQRDPSLPPLNICLEVNISNEKTKSGIAPAEMRALATYCLTLPSIQLRGLMAIPAATDSPEKQREAFHQMALLFHELNKSGIPLDTLSMGMSADFETAIQEGATIVRIGSAIFGQRS